ncbi:hypothetical protein [Chitinophaga pinensis]|uniref:Uncharacterized protein n=1 Tax=Chitinophaga pinensis TaxID=79329 RepID=A0A5C6LLY6_9BACT|nr:hypothetical protein [Chitinophaga pinensis]TWV97359.1 hypothetical protein FEF09_22115 [Chitinophaga pinensis]
MMDGKIQLRAKVTGITKIYENTAIADTLWQYTGTLDISGETKVTLPDSIFPKADLTYFIDCIFTNSNNEQKRTRLSATYLYNNTHVDFRASHDTLYITYPPEKRVPAMC